MENYSRINPAQSSDTIGREIERQLGSYPDINEIIYLRVPGTLCMYSAHILNVNELSPPLRDTDFIDAVPASGLAKVLDPKSFPRELPRRIRVIRPDREKDMWGVFFKR